MPTPQPLEGDVEDKIPRLALKSVVRTAYTSDPTGQPQADFTGALAQTRPDPAMTEATPAAPLTAQDVLQDLAKHYLDALYLSRTSLAYFTKGPLSRARAALVGSVEPGGLQASELVAFLREAILTASVMDKKYRDGIASIVMELPAPGLETPEQPTKAKKKRKWKSKRDKAGFYTEEKDHVGKWWRLDDLTGGACSSAETADTVLKRRTPRLRSRETYLQITLALEVLALESSLLQVDQVQLPTTSGLVESQAPETQGDESQALAEGKKMKTKKLQDLPALLETLIERLCIWHSLESSSPAKAGGAYGDNNADGGKDELKSFCIEVIIPFYMTRIPQHAATVNKKLGGPSAPTPAKRKSASSRKPGEPAVRQAPDRKPRKPLARVASEALNHGSRAMPSLHRAATDTDALLAHIKREASETPAMLNAIPQAKLPQPRKRTSLMHSMSFNKQREVDLSANSRTTEEKLRKNAELQGMVQDAITTLKKPNRALAVKEVAENADLSFAKATATARIRPTGAGGAQRAKLAAAAAAGQGVHVTATPKHGRIIRSTPGRASHAADLQLQKISSSATTHVPSSSARLIAQPSYEAPPSITEVPQTGHRPRHSALAGVEETPSRGFAKFMSPGLARLPGTLESPITARRAQREASYHAELGVVGDSPMVSRRTPVIEQTSVRPIRNLSLVASPALPAALVAASPNLLRAEAPRLCDDEEGYDAADFGKQRKKGSVYDALGWEDEYEELA
ncbi:hypothetical protein LTR36_000913 [Oleoguttula mirabilis]|uniref:DNA replication regulator Sld3 C-terminal domain-containing protein n=1 Tax=Oleoguttula mirabilis TaxID=1507867 RepID=A0AAV9JRW1_9PEZI|nr:hypothetical protein LTR36_000913 [Oleoguttula mirabilis]